MKKKAFYTTVREFLCDDDFIRYTLDNATDSKVLWSSYLNAPTPARTAFLRATDILLHLDECTLLTEEQMRCLRRRIFHSLTMTVN